MKQHWGLGVVLFIGVLASNQVQANSQMVWESLMGHSQSRIRNSAARIFRSSGVQSFLNHPNTGLKLVKEHFGRDGYRVKFQTMVDGIEVVGASVTHRSYRTKEQVVERIAQFSSDTQPTLSPEEAIHLARSILGDRVVATQPELKIMPDFKNHYGELVYQVNVAPRQLENGYDVLVNAHEGRILGVSPHQIPLIQEEVHHQVLDASVMPKEDVDEKTGAPLKIDLESYPVAYDSKKKHSGKEDESVKRAQENSGKVLSFYEEKFARRSYDGKGSVLKSAVHMGKNYPNAFWHRKLNFMAYGDGDGEVLGDLTRSVDVAGHEMTHGVIDSEVQLLGYGEHGALNEALADYLGKKIENSDNWILGGEVFVDPELKKKGLRNLKDPTLNQFRYVDFAEGKQYKRAYPKHMDEKAKEDSFCFRYNDFCWVHANSTIFSHAAYLVDIAIGSEKSEKLFYETIVSGLEKNSDFEHAAEMTLHSCELLYDEDTCSKVKSAFEQVGLGLSDDKGQVEVSTTELRLG